MEPFARLGKRVRILRAIKEKPGKEKYFTKEKKRKYDMFNILRGFGANAQRVPFYRRKG